MPQPFFPANQIDRASIHIMHCTEDQKGILCCSSSSMHCRHGSLFTSFKVVCWIFCCVTAARSQNLVQSLLLILTAFSHSSCSLQGADVNGAPGHEGQPLLQACIGRHCQLINKLMNEFAALPGPAFITAARNNCVEGAKQLVLSLKGRQSDDEFAVKDAINTKKGQPLISAACRGNTQMCW